MDKRAAIRLVQDTLESAFDKSKFAYLVSNMLDHIEAAPFIYRGNIIPDAYKPYISTLERIGKYKDREGNKIDLLIVQLKKETSLERARTMQRNFIAWYLNGSRGDILKDAALVAFVSPDTEDWRFSLVKMDYRQDTSGEKVKVKKELTPARRFSFLVGKNENSHTAQSCLLPVLEKKVQDPTLIEIEKAFDIETVTKEFFLKYRELFLRTKEELDRVVEKDPKIKADFDAKGVDAVNFAKKLLGQIIFLYFLQKKGWFGVGRDDDWGTGSKHFLRELFEKTHGDYNNFFNDILEPLFYEALRTGEDRKHEDYYYSRFNCKIPFLNGGLFDPIGNYDWVKTDIIIPDKLFSNNVKTKEGDKGTGILDVFDRYNFTVKEDEPLEKEVAIDPELLGKSYEKFNAIRPDNFAEFKKALKSGKKGEENKFNKKFGVYYTPREIVHYMCQQSLINYLHTEVIASKAKQSLIPSKEDIETLIHTGEQVSENEARVLSKGKETKTYPHQLPESIRKNAKLLDDKLAEITVCDPAVGSGAFPVGMMSEIVKIRNVLTPFLSLRGAQSTCLRAGTHRQAKQSQFDDKRTVYNFKRRCIEHSLYGVDIDPGAVEIAKLRLWLSLVVDEDDIKNIKPLPNLDYRIMQGNSLISEFMGINFDDDENKNLKKEIEELNAEIKTLKKEKSDKESKSSRHYKKTIEIDQNLLNEINVLDDKINKLKKKHTLLNKKLNHQEESPDIINLISEFQKKKNIFLNESNVSRKSQLKNEVDVLLIKIFESKLKTQKADYFNRLKNIENKYSVVRNEKQRDELIKQDKEKFYKESGFDLESTEKQLKEFTSGKKIKPFFLWNLYFSEVFLSGAKSAFSGPNKDGFDVVIANPPYVLLQDKNRDTKLLHYFRNKYSVASYKIDLYHLFIEKGVQLLGKGGCITYITPSNFSTNNYAVPLRRFLLTKTSLKEILFFEEDVFAASVNNLIFVATNSNAEYVQFKSGVIVDSILLIKQKARISQSDLINEKCVLIAPANTRSSRVLRKIEEHKIKLGRLASVNFGMQLRDRNKFKKDVIENPTKRSQLSPYHRPCYTGKDIHRYAVSFNNRYCFFNRIAKRGGCWNELVHNNKGKLLIRQVGPFPEGGIDEKGYAVLNTAFMIVPLSKDIDSKFLLAIINSSTVRFYWENTFKDDRSTFPKIKGEYLKLLPVPEITEEQQHPFITIVDRILAITKDNDCQQNPQKQTKVKALEAEIDQLVYKLYDLTPEEIKIVEGKE